MSILSQLDQNLTFQDALLAIRNFWTFNSSKHLLAKEELKLELQEYFDAKVVLADSGRTSLYLGLLALKQLQPNKKEVLVSGYTCNVVINSILKAKLVPIFVDISPKDFSLRPVNLNSKVNENTLAVIVQNTFGFADNYTSLMQFTKDNNLYLIEDLAHSFGSQYLAEKLGTFGDFAFMSFGSGKIVSSSRGGALITKNKKIHKYVSVHAAGLSAMPAKHIRQHLHKIIYFYFLSKIYFLGGKQILAVLSKLNFFPRILTDAEKKIEVSKIEINRYPAQLASIALNQLSDLSDNLAHRHQISEIYLKELADSPKIKLFRSSQNQYYLLGFPLTIEKPRTLHKKLLKKRIQLNLEWSLTNIVPSDINHKRTQYILNSCKRAEKIAKHMIYLPTHIQITPIKATKLCKEILKSI